MNAVALEGVISGEVARAFAEAQIKWIDSVEVNQIYQFSSRSDPQPCDLQQGSTLKLCDWLLTCQLY